MSSLLRAVRSAAAQGVTTGIWVAAAGLTPARRRLVRVGAVGLAVGVMLLAEKADKGEKAEKVDKGEKAEPEPRVEPEPAAGQDEEQPFDNRKLVLLGASLVAGVGVTASRRFWERRWLARLQRQGHPHPYRALGVRMGALSGATALISGLTRPDDLT